MLDRLALLLTRPAILALARPLARAGVSANALTCVAQPARLTLLA